MTDRTGLRGHGIDLRLWYDIFNEAWARVNGRQRVGEQHLPAVCEFREAHPKARSASMYPAMSRSLYFVKRATRTLEAYAIGEEMWLMFSGLWKAPTCFAILASSTRDWTGTFLKRPYFRLILLKRACSTANIHRVEHRAESARTVGPIHQNAILNNTMWCSKQNIESLLKQHAFQIKQTEISNYIRMSTESSHGLT